MDLTNYKAPTLVENRLDRIASERAEMLKKFLDRLNPERIMSKRRAFDARFIAVKLAHIPTGDLYAFYQQCEKAKNFGAYFWWALKPQEKKNV